LGRAILKKKNLGYQCLQESGVCNCQESILFSGHSD